jgi:hypothetical protein
MVKSIGARTSVVRAAIKLVAEDAAERIDITRADSYIGISVCRMDVDFAEDFVISKSQPPMELLEPLVTLSGNLELVDGSEEHQRLAFEL